MLWSQDLLCYCPSILGLEHQANIVLASTGIVASFPCAQLTMVSSNSASGLCFARTSLAGTKTVFVDVAGLYDLHASLAETHCMVIYFAWLCSVNTRLAHSSGVFADVAERQDLTRKLLAFWNFYKANAGAARTGLSVRDLLAWVRSCRDNCPLQGSRWQNCETPSGSGTHAFDCYVLFCEDPACKQQPIMPVQLFCEHLSY